MYNQIDSTWVLSKMEGRGIGKCGRGLWGPEKLSLLEPSTIYLPHTLQPSTLWPPDYVAVNANSVRSSSPIPEAQSTVRISTGILLPRSGLDRHYLKAMSSHVIMMVRARVAWDGGLPAN